MKIKGIIVFFVVFGVVVLGIAAFFKFRPHDPISVIPQEFAQVPEKPKLLAEFTAKFHPEAMMDPDAIVPESFSRNVDEARPIFFVAFSPIDASLIASINRNGTINLWDRDNTEAPVKVLSHPEIFPSIGFSPDGKLLASAHWRLVLWDVATGKKINTLETSYGQFAFSPDGHQLATVRNEVKLWDIRSPKKIREIATFPFNETQKDEGWACAVDISPNGKWIAIGYSHGAINVWDLKTKQLVKTLATSHYTMDYLKFSPDNKFLVAGGPVLYKGWISRSPIGYSMWELPSWKRQGEVLRGNIDNLVFSPDGKICVSANGEFFSGRGAELWSVESGAPLTSLLPAARDVSFSQDGRLLAAGGEDGIIRVWELNPQHLDLASPSDVVRIVYQLPNGKTPTPNITQKVDKSIKAVQDFYADEMERHGFGRKTFTFETDANGNAKVYLIRENQAKIPDLSNDIWLVVLDDTSELFGVVFQLHNAGANNTFDFSTYFREKGNIWGNDIEGYTHGKLVYASVKDLNRKPLAYVLRNAFGLPYLPNELKPNALSTRLKRLFYRVNNMMPWGQGYAKLTRCEAEWLDKSRFFNPNQPFFDKRPKIEMTVSAVAASDTRLFTFEVADADGMHQAQLFVPLDINNQRWQKKFHDCQALKGKEKAAVVFEITNPKIEAVVLRMIDVHGTIAQREFVIRPKTDEPAKEH